MQLKITEKAVAAIAPPTDAVQAYYWDTEDTGFGLVVGKTGSKTFVVRARVAGSKKKVTIGAWAPGPWNVARARRRAKELLGEMAAGSDPNAAHRRGAGGITLREGMELHIAEMRDKKRREVSIRAYTDNVPRLLPREIDRPLAELTVEAVQRIKERGRAHRTMTNRLIAYLSAIWNTTRRLRRSTFTQENPIGRLGVARYVLSDEHEPERPSVQGDDLAEWLRRVGLIANPIRRDLQMLALFTGMRDLNVRTLRWEVVDWKRGGFVIPMSKTTPFTIPFSATVRAILEHRRDENPILFAEGGDGGWIFPTTNRKGDVIPVAETKEYASDTIVTPWRKHGPERSKYKPTGKRVALLPGMHTLRRTFLSIADAPDVRVPKHVQMLLSNHSFAGRDVHEDYLRDEWATLVHWVNLIDEAVWNRLGGRQPSLRRPELATSQASTAILG